MNYRISIREIRLNNGGYEYGKHGRYYGNVRWSRVYQIEFKPIARDFYTPGYPSDERTIILEEIESDERKLERNRICSCDSVARSMSRNSLKQQILSVLPNARFFR